MTGDGLHAQLNILQAPTEALLPFKRSRELFPPFSVQVQALLFADELFQHFWNWCKEFRMNVHGIYFHCSKNHTQFDAVIFAMTPFA